MINETMTGHWRDEDITTTLSQKTSSEPSIRDGICQEFSYSNLIGQHNIILLKILPHATDGQGWIEGKLIHVSLDDSPEYTAISYSWGSSEFTDQLWLDDTHYLPLTSSAAHILKNILAPLYIRIDSVCINQLDDEEKSKQVFMM